MKKLLYFLGLISILIASISCDKKEGEVTFKDQVKFSLYDYMVMNPEHFSSFLKIVEKGGVSKVLTAYNPYAAGYTLFLPDNRAIDKFISESDKFASLDELLNDGAYVQAMCRYHVVGRAYRTQDFPFGAFAERTLSGDFLAVTFVSNADSAYYNINNQAPVVIKDIEASNGYIHILSFPLEPIVYNTYEWLNQNPGYSIFRDAIDLTGTQALFSRSYKDQGYGVLPFTLLLEHDSIFNKRKIYNVQDLINKVSPSKTDYTNPLNPLYNFVTYHVLSGDFFINDFEKRNTNYTTYSDVPIGIADVGLYIAINKGKEVFDTIRTLTDTTIIDYVGFNYDASNVLTTSGVIHFIDQVLTQKPASLASQYYQFFWEEPYLRLLNSEPGSFIVDDSTLLYNIKYSGSELIWTSGETSTNAWDNNYLSMYGNFSLKYRTPRVVQGTYKIRLRAECFSQTNALVQVFIDGKNIGGIVNLTTGGSSANPFEFKDLGLFTFIKYDYHEVEIKSLIPGTLHLDVILFDTNLN